MYKYRYNVTMQNCHTPLCIDANIHVYPNAEIKNIPNFLCYNVYTCGLCQIDFVR